MNLDEKQISREIDGVTYLMNPLPWGVGRPALMRLTRMTGPVLAAMNGANGMAAAMGAIAGALSDDDVTYFARLFGNASWYLAGEKKVPLLMQNQDEHFTLRYTAFFEWLAMGVELNFARFFSDVATLAKGFASRTTGEIPSASTVSNG